MQVHDCRPEAADAQRADAGISHAADALRAGKLIVFPTDTVYAIGAGAFDPQAVAALLAAKRRGADKPASVLVADLATAEALVQSLPPEGRLLTEAFWPGALSLILPAAPSLAWNLGNTAGTVMVRMPDHPLALALLRSAGPVAQSSANLTGRPPATSLAEARAQLGDTVHTYLDGGPSGNAPSTIVDFTAGGGGAPAVVRTGVIPRAAIDEVLGGFGGSGPAA
ncbi:L-threonylcarbamoyladenylate synthase [Streptomyces sp. NPDC057654]|uniref:L-threonylcarbamoyladenylate synthase n=1 Tax=Streptomyces sp. NPDC057654 TaxID=3346196 RepID=UPI003699B398